MNIAVWLFVYTPLPWLAAMYALAYRHDLARIANPLEDHASLADWWEVFRHLGLMDGRVKKPVNGFRLRSWLPLFAAVTIESLWAIIPSLAWYELCALEAAAAVPLFIALANAVGPFPYKPFQDSLPYPRPGTRVRHLAKRKTAGHGASGQSVVAPSTREGGLAR